jgi:hypothetical protein
MLTVLVVDDEPHARRGIVLRPSAASGFSTDRRVRKWQVRFTKHRAKNCRLSFSFRTVFYAHEAHGIELIRDQLPAHRGVKQDAHQILEMRLALRREGETLQPVFDRKRFDLIERALGPFRLYVILEP